MTTPRTRVVLTATVLALATAGCGGDSDPASAPSGAASSSPSPSASPTPGPVTSADASAAATKINLTAADLSGYTATPPDETTQAGTEAAEDALATCVGATTTDPVADFSSDDFTKGMELPALTVSSSATFSKDAAEVKQDIEAFNGPKAESCVVTFFKDVLTASAEGLPFEEPKVTRLTPTAPGTDGSFGFRITTSAEAEGQKIPFTFDLLAFGKARTGVALSVFGVGTGLAEGERDALFAKLVERGTANAL